MPLDPTSLPKPGELLLFHPVHGWGWTSRGPELGEDRPIKAPPEFFAEYVDSIYIPNMLVGGIARVTECEHEFAKYYVYFYAFLDHEVSLSAEGAHFTATVCLERPQLVPNVGRRVYEWLVDKCVYYAGGHAVVRKA
jgi:hypothetical protein